MREQLIEGAITRAVEALVGVNGARTVTETRARTICERLAHEAATAATSSVLHSLKTSGQVAEELGVNRQRVWQLAKSRQLGWHIGRDIIFTPAEVDQMRDRKPGRPRRNQEEDASGPDD
ncbi:DNA-binding protein [Nitrolancea hollandica]|uniref:Uncharacterized protein n=1 Tax=Nitrolancea hollandica Lb TaxID=1129897 RepID=I4EG46_9BACT|nr:DNA-binding protein [Nitrolancea hollandica]CCF83658.1 hypothetical protein NITHO_2520033 [Nitrolancea hollandica Lb]